MHSLHSAFVSCEEPAEEAAILVQVDFSSLRQSKLDVGGSSEEAFFSLEVGCGANCVFRVVGARDGYVGVGVRGEVGIVDGGGVVGVEDEVVTAFVVDI